MQDNRRDAHVKGVGFAYLHRGCVVVPLWRIMLKTHADVFISTLFKYQMEYIKQIRIYMQELKQIDSDWESRKVLMIDNFKATYGIMPNNLPLNNLGLENYYINYEKKRYEIEDKIVLEYIKCLSELSHFMSGIITKPPALDCSIPFCCISGHDSQLINSSQSSTKQDKILYYFFNSLNKYQNFKEIESAILKEPDFFNQNDVIIMTGISPKYKQVIRYSGQILRRYKVIDKKGNLSVIGKWIKDIMNKKIHTTEGNYRYINKFDGKFNEYELIDMINNFLRFEDLQNMLIKYDGSENLQSNIKLIKEVSDIIRKDSH